MLNYIDLKLLVIALLLCFPETQIWGWTPPDPQVTPSSYIEDSKGFIQFQCEAYLYSNELLCWYQKKGSETILLNMTQQDYLINDWRTVELYKTLQLSDNGTEILCARETIWKGQIYMLQESHKILINFQKNITPFDRYVTIEPKTDDVILFDEHAQLRFTCSGSKPIDNRTYTWYLQDPGKIITYALYQGYDTSSNTNILTLHLNMDHHQNQLFCAQDYQVNLLSATQAPSILRYGELARSNMIRLIHQGKGEITDKPLVRPEKFIDNNNSHIELKCHAFLQKKELLSWYQIKGSGTILLKMTQLENLKYEKGQWILLALKKTLLYSDNGTNFYCAKERLKPDGNFSKGLESERIPIMFEREILALDFEVSHENVSSLVCPTETPVVAVEPKDTTVYFDVGNTLYFNCSGSKPLDGRNYTWFIRDPDAKLTIPMDQTYDASTNQNTLTLSMHESHHENTLFCAQKYHLYIQHSNGSSMKMYGELARSNMITLVQWEKGTPTVEVSIDGVPDVYKQQGKCLPDNENAVTTCPYNFTDEATLSLNCAFSGGIDDEKYIIEFGKGNYTFKGGPKSTTKSETFTINQQNRNITCTAKNTAEYSVPHTYTSSIQFKYIPPQRTPPRNPLPPVISIIGSRKLIKGKYYLHNWTQGYDYNFGEEETVSLECYLTDAVQNYLLSFHISEDTTSVNETTPKERTTLAYKKVFTLKKEHKTMKCVAENKDRASNLPKNLTSIVYLHYNTATTNSQTVWWAHAGVLFTIMIIITIIVVIICWRKKEQRTEDAIAPAEVNVHPYEEIVEDERTRPPCPPPPELVYAEVYDHGAGLKRPKLHPPALPPRWVKIRKRMSQIYKSTNGEEL